MDSQKDAVKTDRANGVPEPLDLTGFLPYQLAALAHTVSRSLAREYVDRFDLTIPEWRIMAALGLENDLSASDLVERCSLDKVQVSRAMDRLLRSGRIQRRTDRQDRRRAFIRLTRAGLDTYRAIVPVAGAYQRDLLSVLSESERQTLQDLVRKLDGRARQLQQR